MKPSASAVLSGEPRDGALAVCDELVEVLSAGLLQSNDPHQLADSFLFLAKVAQRREVQVDFEALAQRAVDSLSETTLPTVLNGLLGWGLTMQCAFELLGTELDVCAEIETTLDEAPPVASAKAHDFVAGAAGQLVFLAARPDTALTSGIRGRLVEQLLSTAHADEHGTFWQGVGAANLGVAHGCAGVTTALAALHERGYGTGKTQHLLERTVAFLFGHKNPPEASYTFPLTLEKRSGRLAWCYSDLGIAAALLRAGRALKHSSWVAAARDIVEHAAHISVAESGVVDASLCHGAAGAGLLFANLGHRLDSDTARIAATEWFQRVREYRQPGAPLAGFQFNRLTGREDNATIVEGATGIGLALEAACGNGGFEPSWLRHLLGV